MKTSTEQFLRRQTIKQFNQAALQAECASTIRFLMSQIERLASYAFSNDPKGWLAENEAMKQGKAMLDKLKAQENASGPQAFPKGRWS